MANFFISLYNFLHKRKWLLYTLIIVTTAIFSFFALKLDFEEDISKLLPSEELEKGVGIAFNDMQVKDKIFLQFVYEDENHPIDNDELIVACDTFVEHIWNKDSVTQYIGSVLYSIDDEMMMELMDYAMGNIPLLIDSAMYPQIDLYLSRDSIMAQMVRNRQLIDESDENVNKVVYDPAGLSRILLSGQNGVPTEGLGGNFKVNDHHLFSNDGTEVLAFLSPNIKSLDSKAGTKLVELIEQESKAMSSYAPGIKVYFHGAPVNSVGNSRRIRSDLLISIGFSVLVICLLMWIAFKNTSTLPMLLLPVVYGTIFALACMYWIKGTMSLMAIGLGAIVLGVALSYCLHVLTHYKYVSDPVRVLKEQSVPVILSCLTTIGAFFGLLLTKSPLLRDFGLFSSLALVGSTLSCLIFMPHFFRPENNRRSKHAFNIINHVNRIALDRKKWLVVLLLIISGVCIYTSRWLKFDSDLKNIGYTTEQVAKSKQMFDEKNNQGCASVYFASVSTDLDSALEYNKTLLSAIDSLQLAGDIKSYSKMSKLLLSNEEKTKREARWNAYFTPEKLAEIRSNITLAAKQNDFDPQVFEPFLSTLESEFYTQTLVEADILPSALMSNIMEESDGNYLVFTSVLMAPEKRQETSVTLSQIPHAIVVDPFFYTNDMVDMIISDFNTVLLISMIFVFIVLLVSFRSLSRALLAFLPMCLSWFIVQGVMGIFNVPFNLINIVISTFIFGIGVDYSIFIMDGLIAQHKGESEDLLMQHKAAIILSALVLIIVVSSLLLARHPVISSIGSITLVGMVSTILLTYTLQPFLFRQLMKIKFFSIKQNK
ncbi:MAG: MMPL family transporter [Bacteroidales bacterium]|nr:MMPL family transporter [Bacteroidales bacterium]